MKINKFISIGLSGILLLNVSLVSAGDFSDLIKDSHTTGASGWEDDTGTSFYSGGRITYRFKDNAAYPLLFSAEAPGVTIGCEGYDINGGFVSVLGWDKIQDELSEAGTSALYGAVLIIVSSTPILGDVIDKIQKWSRLIQKLLQNSCEITKNMGRNTIGGSVTDILQDKMLSSDDRNAYNKMVSGIDSNYKAIDDWIETAAHGNEEQTAALIAPLFSKSIEPQSPSIKKTASIGTTASILRGNLDINTDKNFLILSDYISLINDSNSYVKLQNNVNKDALKAKIFFGSFLFGDFLVQQRSIATITSLATASGNFNKEKVKALAKATLQNSDYLAITPRYKIVAPIFKKNIVDIFLDGFDTVDKVVTIPTFDVFIYNIEKQKLDEASNGHTAIGTGTYARGIVALDSKSNKTLSFTWRGFEQQINSKLYNLVDPNISAVNDATINPLNPFTDTGSYVKVLRRYYEANNGAHSNEAANTIKELGKAISFYNAKALYYMIRASVYGQIQSNRDDKGMAIGSEKAEQWVKIMGYYDKMYLKQFYTYARDQKIISQSEIAKKIREIKQMLDRDIKVNRTTGQ